MLKIIAGEYRSRKLLSPPDGEITRPYPQRVKESVFNLLGKWFDGARVLDLFAGVGTVGLEAVSWGAEKVLMVERDRGIFRLLKRNIETLDCDDRATAMCGDALGAACLARAPRPVDLVFIDPPYPMMLDQLQRQRVLNQVIQCRGVMADEGFVILRSPMGPDEADLSIEGFLGPEDHEYGRGMWVLLYEPGSKSERPAEEPAEGEDQEAADGRSG
ncbi:MAG: 16S rRNA (guanine(966)-N(2))-methyltransferase RsmD [Phycisphaerales bacterium]|nr:MAG: 16S rRNA (guanine(966)-N(2))-methyltransferase RsmD [Phycisphaerales bacterium]